MSQPHALLLSTLEDITKDPAYQSLPMKAAAAHPGEAWWDQVDRITQAASEIAAWEIANAIRVVFTTYPGLVETIAINFEAKHERGDTPFVETWLKVNEENYDENVSDMDSDTEDAMREVDDLQALNFLRNSIENALGGRQMDHVDRLQALFGADYFKNATQGFEVVGKLDQSIVGELTGQLAAHEIELATKASIGKGTRARM